MKRKLNDMFIKCASKLSNSFESGYGALISDERMTNDLNLKARPFKSWMEGFIQGWHIKANLFEINISWSIWDVLDIRPDLSIYQCKQVLCFIKRKHDANVGVNWEVVYSAAEFLYPS